MTSATRPVVGVICCTRAIAGETGQIVIDRYLESLTVHAACAALLVPARPDWMAAADVADRFDGLLLTGSPSNVAPARFGRPDDPGEGPYDAGRDAMAQALIEAMIARGRPVLGICRGFQELNVAFGGTLQRGLAGDARALPHHAPDDASLDAMFGHAHDVTLAPAGILARTLGRERLTVNSVHYQGIERLGAGLAVEALADDGLVEAVSTRVGGATVLGVQWHPEWQTDRDAASRAIFGLFGRALRGEAPAANQGEHP